MMATPTPAPSQTADSPYPFSLASTPDPVPRERPQHDPLPRSLRTDSPRGGPLADLIRLHCKTLFGLRRGDPLPLPATEADKATWGQNMLERDDPVPSTDDPCFPYPGGPGHCRATPETLDIIWRMMRERGVRSFRPDLSQGPNSQDNSFLWTLAVDSFLELISAGEYTGLTDDMTQKEVVRTALLNHVHDRLMRLYREQTRWSNSRVEDSQKLLRRRGRLSKLRQARTTALLAVPQLHPLLGFIADCCSEDETDNDSSVSSDYEMENLSVDSNDSPPQRTSRTNRRSSPKRTVVLRYFWRSPQMDVLMQMVDAWRKKRNPSGCRRSPGPPPAIRRRPEQPQLSTAEPKMALPGDCYDSGWLQSLSTFVRSELKMKPDSEYMSFASLLQFR